MMETEIRILNINIKEWTNFLETNGAKKEGEWLQKRKTYDFSPKKDNKWLRLRTNGIETVLTIKEIIDKNRIDGTRELEVAVSDFKKTAEILEELGYTPKSYQENKRIRYIYKDLEFDIDTWPMINTYVEIEGDKEKIEQFLKEVPLDVSQQTTIDVESIYREIYGIDIKPYKVLTFESQIK